MYTHTLAYNTHTDTDRVKHKPSAQRAAAMAAASHPHGIASHCARFGSPNAWHVTFGGSHPVTQTHSI